jgi:hypothetical protein
MTGDPDDVRKEFGTVVNMKAAELKRWLDTEESKSVGWAGGARKSDSGGGESVGHEMGRHIIGLLEKKKADLDDDDYAHMRKVIGYVHRHVKQKPTKESIEDSRWRYSLMNWGHDPLKD